MEQLLWIETLIKGSLGACLMLSPNACIRLFGLPPSSDPFWPRLVGATLFSLSIIIFMAGAKILPDGISLGGLAVLNLGVAVMLLVHYMAPRRTAQPRGRTLLGLLGLGLGLLAVFELALR